MGECYTGGTDDSQHNVPLVPAFLKGSDMLNARVSDENGKVPLPVVIVLIANRVEKMDRAIFRNGRDRNVYEVCGSERRGYAWHPKRARAQF